MGTGILFARPVVLFEERGRPDDFAAELSIAYAADWTVHFLDDFSCVKLRLHSKSDRLLAKALRHPDDVELAAFD